MANVSITPANVIVGTGASTTHGIAGATITAGQVCYLDSATTGKWQLADADAADAASRGQGKVGVALNGASLNQPITLQVGGDLTVGGTLVPGSVYYLSDDAGSLMPEADIETGDFVTIVGVAKSASILSLAFKYTGVEIGA